MYKLLFFILIFGFVSNLEVPYTHALTSTSTPTASLSIPTGLVTKIQEAKTLLTTAKLSHTTTPIYRLVNKGTKKKPKNVRTLTGYKVDQKDIVLAVYDPATTNIALVLGKQKDKAMTFNHSNVQVSLAKFNGVNSLFKVTNPAGGTVLALKYLITPTEQGSKDAIAHGAYEAVYTPFSAGLMTAEVSEHGANYIQTLVNQAAQEIGNIPSSSQPGKKIVEVITPELVRALMYAEHIDTTEFLNSRDTQSTIQKVNTLFAGNEGDTYKYSVSSAGARGLAQFMPGTYQALVGRHPQANLNPSFVAGMNDHVNSVKAMYLLLDDYSAGVKDRASTAYIPAHAFEYAAAAYNGGVTRIAKAAVLFGANWFYGQPSEASLRTETVNYIAKLHRLIQVFNS
jgi:hypothetical protein